jgi:demethoxyubiquinone hydroxylase (CLK1/Coq7/Cat5 family)
MNEKKHSNLIRVSNIGELCTSSIYDNERMIRISIRETDS